MVAIISGVVFGVVLGNSVKNCRISELLLYSSTVYNILFTLLEKALIAIIRMVQTSRRDDEKIRQSTVLSDNFRYQFLNIVYDPWTISQKLEPQPEEDKMLEADPQETLDNESLPAPIWGLEKFSRNFQLARKVRKLRF